MTVLDLNGNEVDTDEWTEWQNSAKKTVTLEFTRAELEVTAAALTCAHESLLAESIKLRGVALQDACRVSAAILSVLVRAGRHLDYGRQDHEAGER